MPHSVAYDFVVNRNDHSATLNSRWTLWWEFAKRLIAELKAHGWTTRGSSRMGTAGTNFSATPNGVDYWAGASVAQVSKVTNDGDQRVWHVLQNTLTGLQFCIEVLPRTEGFRFIVSVNKLESAGAWRGGGTDANTRPTDLVSTPAAGREVSTAFASYSGSLFDGADYTANATAGYRFSFVIRQDGKGFYAYYWPMPLFWPWNTASVETFACGVCPALASSPDINSLNPYLVFFSAGTNMEGLGFTLPDVNHSFRIEGRRSDGVAETYIARILYFGDSGTSVDYGTARDFMQHAIHVTVPYTVGQDVRGCMPDVLHKLHNGTHKSCFTWNDRKYVQLADVLFPWDETTDLGGTPGWLDPGYVVNEGDVAVALADASGGAGATATTFSNQLADAGGGDELGVDFDLLDNFPASFVLAKGRKNLANAIARRLQTPAGFLADAFGGDPDYGYDLRGELNRAQSLDHIAGIEAAVKAQCELDERVLSADAAADFDLASGTLTVRIALEDGQGPFTLILNVSEVTTDVVLTAEVG